MKEILKNLETISEIERSRSRRLLTVIGAGPGDVELITLKAIKALQKADVVLYDALIDTQLLEYAPQAEHIFVGKRRGCYSYQQEQINELIVQRAKQGKHVVRLKGGDPFVFGRGAEEMEYAAAHGLEVAIVPGISSCLSVPAAQNIPVTKRGSAESFWVITGTTKEHKLSNDVRLAAKSSATVVILMGMSKLSQIVTLFKKEGKSKTPIAIIQNGTRENEKVGVGTIDSIEREVERKELANPAIIIIGEVVRHRDIISDLQGGLIRRQHLESQSSEDLQGVVAAAERSRSQSNLLVGLTEKIES
ncbi:uroporphyrinogen-III C-methyltransferase [Costertonia aggregata]|uniref:uroporphyrinogen-III C-methyltransferase n=1 Tax=Costertonia aggregata TaxID=343403 RepID=A0A7H9ALX4_9FLAO|nr:uroporphyrinogen-III C-methyltransferase [Costertonia aggregata]QLG44448.1 uroporphyrinogen-III C-methyltransferase [Costertonia aggregata]